MAFKTPHSTVRKRKIHIDFNPKTSKRRIDNAARREVGKDILMKRWSCYSSSPLYNFSSDDSAMNSHSNSLSSYLLANVGGSLSLDMSFPHANVSVVRGLAIHTEEPDAIKIKVAVESGKNVLELYLCSVDCPQQCPTSYDKKVAKSFTSLPLLMYSGQKAYFSKVSSWLELSFGCYVKPMKFSAIDLRWMVALWTSVQVSEEKERNASVTEFVWEIPVPGLRLKKIKYSLEQQSVLDIWKCVKRSSGDQSEVTLADVDYFMAFISRHLKKSTNIKFDALKLISISVPFVHAGVGGIIKISSQSHVHTVLAHLCCLATERVFPFLSDEG